MIERPFKFIFLNIRRHVRQEILNIFVWQLFNFINKLGSFIQTWTSEIFLDSISLEFSFDATNNKNTCTKFILQNKQMKKELKKENEIIRQMALKICNLQNRSSESTVIYSVCYFERTRDWIIRKWINFPEQRLSLFFPICFYQEISAQSLSKQKTINLDRKLEEEHFGLFVLDSLKKKERNFNRFTLHCDIELF